MKSLEEKAAAHAEKVQYLPVWSEVKKALADAYLAGATEALAAQWHHVAHELPPAEQDVLVELDTPCHQLAVAWLTQFSDGTLRWYSYDDTFPLGNIKYWMPIPQHP